MGKRADTEVRLMCRVLDNGAVDGCAVTSIKGLRGDSAFAKRAVTDATLKLTPAFRMAPVTSEAQPVGGAAVIIPIVYRHRFT